MTVAELIEKLKLFPQDAAVVAYTNGTLFEVDTVEFSETGRYTKATWTQGYGWDYCNGKVGSTVEIC
jgi:hypothetical protein